MIQYLYNTVFDILLVNEDHYMVLGLHFFFQI